MNQADLTLFVIKLILGGITAFFAIMLWSKTRDIAWMCLVAGTITAYAGIVYDMMNIFGIFMSQGVILFGIPLISLAFSSIPSLFYIAAFIIMIFRTHR